MAANLIINLISIVPLKNEHEQIDSFFEGLSGDIVSLNPNTSTTYSIILKNTTKTPEIIIFRNDNPFEIIHDSGDLGNIDVLTNIFRVLLENEKGITYTNKILYCWGHAMGFSLFSKITSDDKFIKILFSEIFEHNFKSLFNKTIESAIDLEINNSHSNPIFNLVFNAVNQEDFKDKKELTALTINELCKSIKVNDLKFDLIVFDNCYMQTVDTLYTMKDVTEYIIAPQTSIHWRGYDYTLFTGLTKKIDDSFCSSFCKASFNKLVELSDQQKDKNIAEIAISCISTKNSESYFKAINNLIISIYNILIDENNQVTSTKMAGCISAALSQIADVTIKPDGNGSGLDLFDVDILFTLIIEKVNDTNLKNKLIEFKKRHASMVISHTNAASAFYNNITTGISICFPKDSQKTESNSYYYYFIKDNAQVKSQFADANWDDLLEIYYKDFE